MNKDELLNEFTEVSKTWLNGKYENGEINTSLSYVSVNSPEFFVQGCGADEIIKEVHNIWINNSDYTQEQAFDAWINMYL